MRLVRATGFVDIGDELLFGGGCWEVAKEGLERREVPENENQFRTKKSGFCVDAIERALTLFHGETCGYWLMHRRQRMRRCLQLQRAWNCQEIPKEV